MRAGLVKANTLGDNTVAGCFADESPIVLNGIIHTNAKNLNMLYRIAAFKSGFAMSGCDNVRIHQSGLAVDKTRRTAVGTAVNCKCTRAFDGHRHLAIVLELALGATDVNAGRKSIVIHGKVFTRRRGVGRLEIHYPRAFVDEDALVVQENTSRSVRRVFKIDRHRPGILASNLHIADSLHVKTDYRAVVKGLIQIRRQLARVNVNVDVECRALAVVERDIP